MLGKVFRLFGELREAATFDRDQKYILEVIAKDYPLPKGSDRVLVQIVEDYNYLFRFLVFLQSFFRASKQGFIVDWVWVLIPFRRNRNWKLYFIYEKLKQPLLKRKWCALFLGAGGRLFFSQGSAKRDSGVKQRALEIFRSLSNQQQLLDLQAGGIAIGDLIYDSFLRFAEAPTVDVRHPFVLELIEWSLALIKEYEGIFQRKNYRFYLCTYTSYIHHGIAARVALKNQVPVYAMGMTNQLVTRATPDFPYHKRNFNRYASWAQELPADERLRALELGHAGVRGRLGGVKDEATWYMRKSAYAVEEGFEIENILPPKTRKTALVMGHDFFDSPHIYGRMLYPDFYIWLCETLKILSEQDVEVLVKPHPNGLPANEAIWKEIAAAFPQAKILPRQVSSLELVRRGVDLVVTVYGTVAHEMAYLGVPVVNAGENPHQEFSFSVTPKTVEQYAKILRFESVVPRPAAGSDEVALFYFIHNYRHKRERLNLFPMSVSATELREWLKPQAFAERLEACQKSLAAIDAI